MQEAPARNTSSFEAFDSKFAGCRKLFLAPCMAFSAIYLPFFDWMGTVSCFQDIVYNNMIDAGLSHREIRFEIMSVRRRVRAQSTFCRRQKN